MVLEVHYLLLTPLCRRNRFSACNETVIGLFGATDEWNADADQWDKHDADDPSDPFGSATLEPDLKKLYPSHDGYVATVRAAATAAVRGGYLTPADAATIVAIARDTDFA